MRRVDGSAHARCAVRADWCTGAPACAAWPIGRAVAACRRCGRRRSRRRARFARRRAWPTSCSPATPRSSARSCRSAPPSRRSSTRTNCSRTKRSRSSRASAQTLRPAARPRRAAVSASIASSTAASASSSTRSTSIAALHRAAARCRRRAGVRGGAGRDPEDHRAGRRRGRDQPRRRRRWSQALDAAGERIELSLALADVFSGEIDFNSDLQPGDTFRLLVERGTPRGRRVRRLRAGARGGVCQRRPRAAGGALHAARRQARLLRSRRADR